MSGYIPTDHKLTALGFKQSNAEGYIYEREDQVGPQLSRWMTITQRNDGRTVLYEHYFASGPVEEPRPAAVYCAALPSETFFDELLLAVGWQTSTAPVPTPDKPARWQAVQPGNVGIFLTRNGKYQTFADPVDDGKINKYGLTHWLSDAPPTPALSTAKPAKALSQDWFAKNSTRY